MHVSAVEKDSRAYEHVAPERVGNARHIVVSDQAGKSNLIAALQRTGIEVAKDDPRLELWSQLFEAALDSVISSDQLNYGARMTPQPSATQII